MTDINAFRTGVLGMNAQATKLAAISNNIANSSTVGFKRADTQFESLVLGTATTSTSALAGVTAVTRFEIARSGQLQSTGTATDIAVDGSGFFVVNERSDDSGTYLATRAGSFRVDADGNLVNTAGYYLQGVPTDATGVMVDSDGTTLDGLQTVNVTGVAISAEPTTEMTFWANLPATETAEGASGASQSTSMDYYDQLGVGQSLRFTFTPNVADPAATPAVPANTWNLQITDTGSGGAAIASLDLAFNGSGDDAGRLSAVTGTGYDAATGLLTLGAGNGVQQIAVNIGRPGDASGLTQLASDFAPTRMVRDGSAPGTVQDVTVSSDGKVMASFSNGQSRPIYQLRLATVPNPDGLTPTRGDAYEFSRQAGAILLQDPGQGSAGVTVGGSLESSNVDMNLELTSLIETQRAYSSNATVVRTADEMLQEVNSLKR
jgi:flagellar hook protein FlgE